MAMQKTAVIGAGTMGSGIAAHMANAGAQVVLLDIVPEGADDRSILAKEALEKMKQNGRAFTHPRHAEQIMPGNLEDDLALLEDTQWIVEAVVEDLAIKQDVYARLDGVRPSGSVISSNTSTLPLAQLKQGQSEALRRDLCITHFFNPPRLMQLCELVSDQDNDPASVRRLSEWIEAQLGKTVVPAHDTPGFIANRIGIFWMMHGLDQALKHNVPVELADQLFGKSLGFPKTGIFGLMDMIGLDLMCDITESLQHNLPKDDPYQQLNGSLRLLKEMVGNNQTGKKGGGGFYRKTEKGTEVFDLQDKTYRRPESVEDAVLDVADTGGLHAALETDSLGGRYAWAVLSELLRYTVTLVPEAADDLLSIDTTMKAGFNWQYGPFEMIDALSTPRIDGASWFHEALEKAQRPIPDLLAKAARHHAFYQQDGAQKTYLTRHQAYQPVPVRPEQWTLAEKTRDRDPITFNEAARLWDLDDGIACLELTTKMDIMGNATFDMVERAIETVKADFDGLIIGDDDAHFSAGLNLKNILHWCEREDWDAIEAILTRGQNCWMALKYAPFPVIGAPAGKALGGACEMLLHCDAIQAHMESHIGLVETKIGVVPSWGGCRAMLWRYLKGVNDANSQLQAAEHVFELIADAKTSHSAEEARDMRILSEPGGISMHRQRVLPEAKALCQTLARQYEAPAHRVIELPLHAVRLTFEQQIARRYEEDALDTHSKHVLQCLAYVLSGGASGAESVKELELEVLEDSAGDEDVPTRLTEAELLALERKAFMALIRHKETQQRIQAVL